MRAFLKKVFLAEPRLLGAGFRYGLLAVILALLVFQACVCPHLSPSYPGGKYSRLLFR
jgi:hypothetical protein